MTVPYAAVLAAFPRRSFRVRKSVGWSVFFTSLAALGMLVWFGWMRLVNGPAIARDWQIADGAKRTPARLVSKCKIAKAILWECDFEIVPVANGRPGEPRVVSIAFVSFREHRYSAAPVASARFPDHVTTDFALEHLMERTLTLAGGVLLLGLATFGLFVLARGTWRQWRAFAGMAGQPLRAVPVFVVAGKTTLGTEFRYRYADGPPQTLKMGRKDKPFWLAMDTTPPTALAVVGPDSDIPMLLDENLTRLDFTDAERDALRRARASMA